MKLKDIFEVKYGHQLDLCKQTIVGKDQDGYNFVSRSSKNLGVKERIRGIPDLAPLPSGLLTVALGGSVLSTFVQPKPFYTGQNIKVLTPKNPMSLNIKLYYCGCIKHNAFRYAACGREANITLDDLLLPSLSEIPKYVKNINTPKPPSRSAFSPKVKIELTDRKWSEHKLVDHFDMRAGKYHKADSYFGGSTPLVSAKDENNGVMRFTNLPAKFDSGITVGKTSMSNYYQAAPFVASSDVTVLQPKFKFNGFIAMFLITILNLEKYKWNYGRQIRLNDCGELSIKLPVDESGAPDWRFMEDYIKSMPYSGNL